MAELFVEDSGTGRSEGPTLYQLEDSWISLPDYYKYTCRKVVKITTIFIVFSPFLVMRLVAKRV